MLFEVVVLAHDSQGWKVHLHYFDNVKCVEGSRFEVRPVEGVSLEAFWELRGKSLRSMIDLKICMPHPRVFGWYDSMYVATGIDKLCDLCVPEIDCPELEHFLCRRI
ncbi:MAG: hypothetical protein ACOVS5_09985 [Oligoflexus sp.]|jgi:hypothetical protein